MLWRRGCKIEVVAVTRGWEEASRADTVLGNWAGDLRPPEDDPEIGREIKRIEDVLRSADKSPVQEAYGDIRGGLVRLAELRNRAHRQSRRGLLHRVETWETERLLGRVF